VRHLRTNTVISSCMTDEELADWTAFSHTARVNAVQATPCEDCTPAFAAEQRALGLCNGFPGEQRFCVPCLRWWPDDNQHWAPRSGPGHAACLTCRKRDRMRRYYVAHREVRCAVMRADYQAHREERLAYQRAHRQANHEKVAAAQRANYVAHRSDRLAYAAAYRARKVQT
jgi:hypothetical protein